MLFSKYLFYNLRQFEVERSLSKMPASGIQFERFYSKVGRKRRRTANQLFTATVGQMSEIVFRYQRVSPSLLGPGETDIAYGSLPAGSVNYVCPFHISSLTSNPLFNRLNSCGRPWPLNLPPNCKRIFCVYQTQLDRADRCIDRSRLATTSARTLTRPHRPDNCTGQNAPPWRSASSSRGE